MIPSPSNTTSYLEVPFSNFNLLPEKLPSDLKELMEQQKKNCFALPGRDKQGRRVFYVRELPDMMSASEKGWGFMEKRT